MLFATEIPWSTGMLLIVGYTYGWLAITRYTDFDSFSTYVVEGAVWSGLQLVLMGVYAILGAEGFLQVLLLILEAVADSQ